MPNKPPHPCAKQGCPNLTREQYCEQHRQEASSSYNRYHRDRYARKYYDTARWRALRKVKLARDAWCEICKTRGVLTKAEQVDHIVEIADGGQPFEIDNLKSLCMSCHSRKTLQERNKRVAVRYEKAVQNDINREYRH